MKKTLFTFQYVYLILAIGFLFFSSLASASTVNGFTVKGSTGYGYDDNVLYSHENEVSDFFTKVKLGLELLLERKTQSLEAEVDLSRQIFNDHTELDNFSQFFKLIFKKELSKYTRLRIDDNFEHAEEATSFAEEFGRVGGRFDTYKNTLSFDIDKELTPHNVLNFYLGNEIKEVEREDLQDSIQNNLGLQWNILASPKTSGFIKYDFTHRLIDSSDNAVLQTIAPGFKRYLTRQVYFTSYAGANVIHTFSEDDIVRPVFYAAISDELDKVSTFTLAYQKKHITTGFDSDIFDQWRVTLDYEREFFERLKGNVSLFYGEGDFIIRDISEKLHGFDIGIAYSLTRNWQANLTYRYVLKDSREVTRDYEKNLAFFGFTFRF